MGDLYVRAEYACRVNHPFEIEKYPIFSQKKKQ